MKFKIEDKVYCSYHEATGTITDIKRVDTYPIYVTFEDGNTDTYTQQGRHRLYSGNICLHIIEKVTGSLTLEYIEGLGKCSHYLVELES